MIIFEVKIWNTVLNRFLTKNILAKGVDDAIDEALIVFNTDDTSRCWTRKNVSAVQSVYTVDAVSDALVKELQ